MKAGIAGPATCLLTGALAAFAVSIPSGTRLKNLVQSDGASMRAQRCAEAEVGALPNARW